MGQTYIGTSAGIERMEYLFLRIGKHQEIFVSWKWKEKSLFSFVKLHVHIIYIKIHYSYLKRQTKYLIGKQTVCFIAVIESFFRTYEFIINRIRRSLVEMLTNGNKPLAICDVFSGSVNRSQLLAKCIPGLLFQKSMFALALQAMP